MKQFLLTMAGVFAGLMLFFIGLPFLLIVIVVSAAKPAPAPACTVLALDLRQPLTDQDPNNPFAFFGARSLSVMSIVQTLNRAAHDADVKSLLIRLPEGGLAPAGAEEIRAAVKAFRTTGKPVLAYSQGLYPSGVSSSTYMLGAAASEFWMQPGASLQSTGLAAQDMFLKRFFDRYGVKADYQQRYEFKNAVNPYLYSDYTPAHRESELGWMTSVYTSGLATAAADRRTDPAQLRAAIEAGPYIAQDARARGLIDRVGQLQDAEGSLRGRAGDGAKIVDFNDYRGRRHRPLTLGDAIAVIGAEGPILTGTADNQSFGSGQSATYSDDVAKAFRDAIQDRQVKAIVFRVSSPGGSDTASEQILAAVRAAKAAGKPVVVSMGTYAASGGYWISSQASEIVAQPTTLTGSIGVFGGKFAVAPALARFGIDLRDLKVGGDYADAFTSGGEFTPAQRAAVSAWMDHIYNGFVSRVAEGRRLSPDRVREIAKGRVWTGAQAKDLGLVDRLGGFAVAVAEAKRLAGMPADKTAPLKTYPSKKSPFEALQRAFGASEASLKVLGGVAWLMGDPHLQSALDAAGRARLQAEGHATVLGPTPWR
jgi:protease-4